MNKGYGAVGRPVSCPVARGAPVLGGHPSDGLPSFSFAGLVR